MMKKSMAESVFKILLICILAVFCSQAVFAAEIDHGGKN
jgi:hypothetical protein